MFFIVLFRKEIILKKKTFLVLFTVLILTVFKMKSCQ